MCTYARFLLAWSQISLALLTLFTPLAFWLLLVALAVKGPFLQRAPPIIIKSERRKKGRQCQTSHKYAICWFYFSLCVFWILLIKWWEQLQIIPGMWPSKRILHLTYLVFSCPYTKEKSGHYTNATSMTKIMQQLTFYLIEKVLTNQGMLELTISYPRPSLNDFKF